MSTALQERVEQLAVEFAGRAAAVSTDQLTAGWSCTVWGAKGESLLVIRGEPTRAAALLCMRSKLRSAIEEKKARAEEAPESCPPGNSDSARAIRSRGGRGIQ